MVFYCKHCFKKIEYKLKKPDNCPHCGKSLSAASRVEMKARKSDISALVEKKPSRDESLDLIDNDGFYDENYQPGKFDSFLSGSKKNGVSVEIEKSQSFKIGDLLRDAGINKDDVE